MVRAVIFDVGETLIDETPNWEHVADVCGVPRFTLMALVGAAIERGESHKRAFEWLGVAEPVESFDSGELYADAVPCLNELRRSGLLVGAVGNMRIVQEDLIRPHVDFAASSERWRVEKPSREFFARIVDEVKRAPEEIAYVGDRVDNDVVPALAAGFTAVHVRRGPWGLRHEPPRRALRIDSLVELPAALAHA